MSETTETTEISAVPGSSAEGRAATPLPSPSDWTFELIETYHQEIRKTAESFKLDTYPIQLEIITAEQMMDAYASVGMPVIYRHWSYGKQFISTEKNYRRGAMGLAYEIVINSDPCIAYLMEENTMAMQALVIAHAAYGHNSFFKGNYLFRLWTDYRLPGQLNKIKVGGGVNVSSSFQNTFVMYPLNGNYVRGTLRQGGYTTVDLMASYEFSKNLEAAVNVTNVFDRKYYTTVGGWRSQSIYGEPRAVMVTLRARY